ncbi:methyltransferase RsmF C-terminal domain-like protein [Limnovirga soli]|uniref:RNA methyltransferase n=1 Tax=Limnovirga soli TaxID=2656915 RepID=A0A8J8FA73_9BACT|nr:SAM-dependent methyltransferase [Limnovirga soli]NNV54010.1 RNA methyltransferase [Limnovirga soli]
MAYPLPPALLQSLEQVTGFNKTTFEAVHASTAQVTSIRLNTNKPITSTQSVLPNTEMVPWCTNGRYLSERPFFTFDPLLHGGAYYVQEASSMFLWHILETTIGEKTNGLKVLDLCAAPGGKSTLLASYFNDGLVVANEVIKSRAAILTENVTKWGSGNVVVTNNDPLHFARITEYFDVLVIDAPCSGSGLFRKDNNAITEWSEVNVAHCSARQQRIFTDIYSSVKRGGIIIYSTCSYSQQEDEDILDWIMQNHAVSSCQIPIQAAWGIIETKSNNSGAFGYRFYPDKIKGEGFFIACFVKEDGDIQPDADYGLPAISKTENALAAPWVHAHEALFLFKQKEEIIAIAAKWNNAIAYLQKHLYIKKAGVTIGTIKGKDLVPAHDLALSNWLAPSIPIVQLDITAALQFLRKKEIPLPDGIKGWAVIDYLGVKLGWVKVLHNRVNNYYPTEWRILKE